MVENSGCFSRFAVDKGSAMLALGSPVCRSHTLPLLWVTPAHGGSLLGVGGVPCPQIWSEG